MLPAMRSRLRLLALATGALALLLGLNAYLTTAEEAGPYADVGRVVPVEGPDLQAHEDGSRDAPALVLLHGFAASMRWWDRIAPALRREHRVVRFDLLGHGGSAKPRERAEYEFERQAAGLRAALDRLGVGRVLLVGNSMGGLTAAALAAELGTRARGVVLLGTAPHPKYRLETSAESIIELPVIGPLLDRVLPDSVVRRALADVFAPGTEVPDEFVADYRDMTFSAVLNARREADEFARERPLDERLATLGLPLLVIFGTEDGRTDQRGFAAYRDVPGVRYRRLEGIGHTPQWEGPGTTARLIARFYARVRGVSCPPSVRASPRTRGGTPRSDRRRAPRACSAAR